LLAHILKSLVKSSPDLQLTGSWGQRWTDQIKISRSKGQRSRSQWDHIWSKTHFSRRRHTDRWFAVHRCL